MIIATVCLIALQIDLYSEFQAKSAELQKEAEVLAKAVSDPFLFHFSVTLGVKKNGVPLRYTSLRDALPDKLRQPEDAVAWYHLITKKLNPIRKSSPIKYRLAKNLIAEEFNHALIRRDALIPGGWGNPMRIQKLCEKFPVNRDIVGRFAARHRFCTKELRRPENRGKPIEEVPILDPYGELKENAKRAALRGAILRALRNGKKDE